VAEPPQTLAIRTDLGESKATLVDPENRATLNQTAIVMLFSMAIRNRWDHIDLKMNRPRISFAILAAALLGVSGGSALAADKGKVVDFTVKSEPITSAPNSGRALKWDASKGRFGLTLDIQQPRERPAVANDVQAGAYFRITPSLRVGGSVALGEQDLKVRPYAARPADAPKVTLQTAFRF
jgi:hypothetical protein